MSKEVASGLFFQVSGQAFSDWPSHLLRYGRLLAPETQKTLDKCMACFMKAPRTFTGEDVVEFHLHGSPVLCDLLVRLATEAGARLARPGEFTQRAFLHGKLDLAQAESVLDLIESRTKAQAHLAAQHLEGRFSKRIEVLRNQILGTLSLLEAEIDFGDDIDNLPETEHRRLLDRLLLEIESLLTDAQQGRVLVQGLKTVFVGAPNAGKSSLLNACLQEDRALVTAVAGTTRDRIDVDCQLQGILFNLTDTAGLRAETDDEVEKLGMEKTKEAVGKADFVVLVMDSHEPKLPSLEFQPDFVLLNKSDLDLRVKELKLEELFPDAIFCRGELLTEEGREQVVEELVEAAKRQLEKTPGECFSLNQRHRESLVRCRESLLRMSETLERGLGAEFLALDLRRAAEALGDILGLDITEEVLDRIFGQFCLGK